MALPKAIPATGTWADEALCYGVRGLFFPDGESSLYAEQIETAKKVCASCPVIRECGEHALTHNEPHGIWGGMTESERKAIRTNRPMPDTTKEKTA